MGSEIVVTALLKEELPYQNTQEKIGNLISYAMLRNEELKAFHKEPVYKFYSYDNLYPAEKTGIYHQNKVYVFRIRMVKVAFARKLKKCLAGLENGTFKILASELRNLPDHFINMLYTITPCIITDDGGPFKPDGDLVFLKQRLEINAAKKYRELYGEPVETSDFIERIEVINHKPTVTRYKNMKYLGNKLRVYIRSDSNSQKLARLVSCAGLGEKSSSLGAGFCFIH